MAQWHVPRAAITLWAEAIEAVLFCAMPLTLLKVSCRPKLTSSLQ